MQSRGIWDIERLTEPYMRGHLLIEIFGKMWTEVRCGTVPGALVLFRCVFQGRMQP
jgi:hypothetical protein